MDPPSHSGCLSPLPSRNDNRYALICQDEGLVPIVEPDISLNGDYDLETAIRVNVKVQAHLYKVGHARKSILVLLQRSEDMLSSGLMNA